MRGFLFVDKGKGLTSFDVVYKIRKWTGEKCVGHAGTLDPLATGLLIVAVGEATKLLEYFIGCDKEYEVKARFGAVSETYDAEGPIKLMDEEKFKKLGKISRKDLEKVIKKNFLGEIEQIPPKYSALKINGQKAMDMARRGQEFEMKPRKVMINDLKVKKFSWPEVVMTVRCGSGTYIRSLVYDIGQEIGCGAYVQELRRLSIDKYNLNGKNTLLVGREFDFVNKNIEQYLLPLEVMMKNWPRLELTDEEFAILKNGGSVLYKKIKQEVLLMAYYKGKIVGILEEDKSSDTMKFRKQMF